MRGRTNRHHAYFYKRLYENQSRLHHIFRNAMPNIFPLLVEDHHGLHERYSNPLVPENKIMIGFLEEQMAIHGLIEVQRSKSDPRIILPDEWEIIKNGTH